MPDWNRLIRERLGSLNLSPRAQDEIVAELAAHLEDTYQQSLAGGVKPTEALEASLNQVTDWQPLARKIERAKQESIMNTRSRQFWLPALLSLAASMIWLMAIDLIADKLHMQWRHANLAFLPYSLWIFSLPVIGAASGRISYGAGGSRRTCFMAVLFPSLIMLVMWLLIVASLLSQRSPQTIRTLSISVGLLAWVVVPGLALLAGTLPLGRTSSRNA